MKVEPMAKHRYRGDGHPDENGEDRCLDCGLGLEQGRAKEAHRPVEVSSEVREISARIVGERGDS